MCLCFAVWCQNESSYIALNAIDGKLRPESIKVDNLVSDMISNESVYIALKPILGNAGPGTWKK